jgi:hypothetical protein
MITLGASWAQQQIHDNQGELRRKLDVAVRRLVDGCQIITPLTEADLVDTNLPLDVLKHWDLLMDRSLPKLKQQLEIPPPLRICVMGVLSNGKSSFINAMLHRALLPNRSK